MEKYLVSNEKNLRHIFLTNSAKFSQIQPKCLRNYVKSLKIKSDKAKLWRSIWLVMKKISAPSDVKFSQIQPKCLRNYAWKMMMWHIVWSKKTGKAKLWRSICLVMKIFRTVSSDVVWPFKNRFRQNRINKNGQQPKCLRILVRKKLPVIAKKNI